MLAREKPRNNPLVNGLQERPPTRQNRMRIFPISLPRLPHVIESRVENDETTPPPKPSNILREDVKNAFELLYKTVEHNKKRERKDYLRPFKLPQQTSPTPDTPLLGRSPAIECRNGLSRMDKDHFPPSLPPNPTLTRQNTSSPK